MKPEEVLATVRELNNEVDGILDASQFFYFEFISDGYRSVVKYLGHCLWSSEDDTRRHFEESDSYEPLAAFLRRERDSLLDDALKHKGVGEENVAREKEQTK